MNSLPFEISRICQCIEGLDPLTLAFSVWLREGNLGFAVRDTEDGGEVVGAALPLAGVTTRELGIRVDSVHLGAVSSDTVSGVRAVAPVDAVEESVQKASFAGLSGGVGNVIYFVHLNLLRVDQTGGTELES